MKKLREKMHKQSGFTLIEMLIVVAIIAILIAISIPLVSTALEQSRIATDAANERSAKAEALIMYMADSDFETNKLYPYDAISGTILTSATSKPEEYGKATDTHKAGNHEGQALYVGVSSEGDVYMLWSSTFVSGQVTNAYKNAGPATNYVNTGSAEAGSETFGTTTP